jgi:hypothetical protein
MKEYRFSIFYTDGRPTAWFERKLRKFQVSLYVTSITLNHSNLARVEVHEKDTNGEWKLFSSTNFSKNN